ncbi:peptide chain release factor N(5)-glutamine methyltransferase [Paracoccus sp. p4-l81]|uniref:peptide chain release factor N(5)-glutamine methyltransferase n=1 Tax=unclassified Paracoccus (in: a-proteobacteria) TaxID=2688777 RepID=UPI0035B7E8DA
MTTRAQALRDAARQLAEAGIPDAPRDARRLLAHVLDVAADRLTLELAEPEPLSPDQQARMGQMVQARAAHQPVAQITGRRSFWGRDFAVTRDTLDPRPETETLIALALTEPFTRLLDLGTGTGCIGLTLLAERPSALGLLTDLSPRALAVAQDNATALGVAARAGFLISDWFAAVRGGFDLIVSNPPYIAADEMAALSPDVRDWEPHLALTPGGDGLDAYRALAAGVAGHLAPGGRLMVEIGPTQGAAVADLWAGAGLTQVAVHPDLDGRDRVVSARAPQ